MPTINLFRSRAALMQQAFSSEFSRFETAIALSEEEQYSFRLDDAEDETEYRVCIGDLDLDDSIGQELGLHLWWKPARYFESARGRVTVHLFSRGIESDDAWLARLDFAVIVIPTKLGDQRYEAMYDDLCAISNGLVFDLLSKSQVGVSTAPLGGGLSSRPASAELTILRHVWARLAKSIEEIAQKPVSALKKSSSEWKLERVGRVDRAELNRMARRGLDPRSPTAQNGYLIRRPILREELDVAEHKTILAILKILYSRIEECERRAGVQIGHIISEKPLRDFEMKGRNPFRDSDMPKVERLRQAVSEAGALRQRIWTAMKLDIFAGLRPAIGSFSTPVFTHVKPYRRFKEIIVEYFRNAMAVLDTDVEERSKATHRMYEQWVFIQLLSCLRSVGLSPFSQEALLSRTQQNRFTIDFDRGTRVVFRAYDGRTLSVRYEPWVYPKGMAQATKDTLYRGIAGEVAWSPDILVEVFSKEGRQTSQAEYAFVIDAKYSRTVRDSQRQAVSKYNEIRGLVDSSPVVKQVWIAHPSDDGVKLWDDAVVWSSRGPDRPFNEVVNGTIGVQPSLGSHNEDTAPNEELQEFVRSVCHYLQLIPASPL